MTKERVLQTIFHWLTLLAFLPLISILNGCGPAEEAMEEESSQPTASDLRMHLQRQIDSLSSENQRLREQVNVLAAENRTLSGQNASLQLRLKAAAYVEDNEPAVVKGEEEEPAIPPAYHQAVALYRQRQYKEASVRLVDLLSTNLRPGVASNCQYWIGECQFAMKNYEAAIQYFEAAIQYKEAEKAADARFMLGTTYAAAGNSEAAREAFNNVVRLYPKSDLARRAKEKLRSIK